MARSRETARWGNPPQRQLRHGGPSDWWTSQRWPHAETRQQQRCPLPACSPCHVRSDVENVRQKEHARRGLSVEPLYARLGQRDWKGVHRLSWRSESAWRKSQRDLRQGHEMGRPVQHWPQTPESLGKVLWRRRNERPRTDAGQSALHLHGWQDEWRTYEAAPYGYYRGRYWGHQELPWPEIHSTCGLDAGRVSCWQAQRVQRGS